VAGYARQHRIVDFKTDSFAQASTGECFKHLLNPLYIAAAQRRKSGIRMGFD